MPRALQPVAFYIWFAGTLGHAAPEMKIPKEEWWDGSLIDVLGRKYIDIKKPYWSWPEPDAELLACGHEQPVKRGYQGRGRKYYNNRRVCKLCAINVIEVPA